MSNLKRLLRYDWPLHFVLVLTNWMPDNVVVLRLRGYLAGFFLGKCGRDLRLGRNITFYNSSNINVGNNVYIAYGCWFSASSPINIADEVLFGPYCLVASSNHTRKGDSYRYGQPDGSPVNISKGVWIGGNVSILRGVTIGKASVVGANSVVNKSVPDYVVFAGNPGRVIKESKDA